MACWLGRASEKPEGCLANLPPRQAPPASPLALSLWLFILQAERGSESNVDQGTETWLLLPLLLAVAPTEAPQA